MKSSGPADFKTDPGFENRPRFVGVIEQNKIQQTFPHDCINTELKIQIEWRQQALDQIGHFQKPNIESPECQDGFLCVNNTSNGPLGQFWPHP